MSASVAALLIAIGLGAGAALVLAGGLAALGIVLVVQRIRASDDRRVADRAAAMARNIYETQYTPEPVTRRQANALEAVMFDLATQREGIDEKLARLEHVSRGGRWDDSPTKWKQTKDVTK